MRQYPTSDPDCIDNSPVHDNSDQGIPADAQMDLQDEVGPDGLTLFELSNSFDLSPVMEEAATLNLKQLPQVPPQQGSIPAFTNMDNFLKDLKDPYILSAADNQGSTEFINYRGMTTDVKVGAPCILFISINNLFD